MVVAAQRLTLEEFLKRPEKKPALEFADGVVTQKVTPKTRHSRLQTKLAEWFNRYTEPRKLAIAFVELRTTFGGASLVPDVAVYRWERLPLDAAGNFEDDCREPPDIAIEIVSPKQSTTPLVRRCLWYVDHGVRMAVLIDPQDRSVIVFRPGGRTEALSGTQQIDFSEVLPGFELSVRDLFASLSVR